MSAQLGYDVWDADNHLYEAVDAYTRLAGVYDEVVVDPCHGALAGFLDELFSADEEPVAGVLRPHAPSRAFGGRAAAGRDRRRIRMGGGRLPRTRRIRAGCPP